VASGGRPREKARPAVRKDHPDEARPESEARRAGARKHSGGGKREQEKEGGNYEKSAWRRRGITRTGTADQRTGTQTTVGKSVRQRGGKRAG